MKSVYDNINEWYALKERLADLKAREVELRQSIFEHFFDDQEKGRQSQMVNAEYELVGYNKMNESIDQELLKANVAKLPNYYQDTIVNRTAIKLSKAGLKKLPDKYKKLINDCITEKPGLCDLKLVRLNYDQSS